MFLDKNQKKPPKIIFIDIAIHLICTLIGCLVIYLNTRNLSYLLIFVIGGVLLDLDHLFDYYLFYRSRLVLSQFLNCFYLNSGKVYLFLHSWELNFIILALALSLKSYGLFLLFASMAAHLVIDNLQRRNPFIYFLLYRAYKRFNVHVLLPEQKGKFFN